MPQQIEKRKVGRPRRSTRQIGVKINDAESSFLAKFGDNDTDAVRNMIRFLMVQEKKNPGIDFRLT